MRRDLYKATRIVWLAFAVSVGIGSGPAEAALQVSTASALEKVRATDPWPGGPSTLSLAAARNEFEAGQLLISGGSGSLSGVDVEASNLVGPGYTLAAGQVSLARVEYYAVTVPSDQTGAVGEWPDGLIPKVDAYVGETRNGFPFPVGAGRLQAVWVEVYVPLGTPAGTYQGTLTVQATSETPVVVPLTLTVWGFDLPSTASLPTAFYTGQGSLVQGHYDTGYVDDATQISLLKRYTDALLLHRVSNQGMVYPAPPSSGGVVDWSQFDRDWGPYLDGTVALPGGRLPGARATTVALQDWGHQDDVSYYSAWATHFRARGWFDRLFHYTMDEPTLTQYPLILSRADALHTADPGLRSLVTHQLEPSLVGAVNIWTPVINYVDNKSAAEGAWELFGNHRPDYDGRIAAGDQLWWYQSCMSHGCGPLDGTPVPVVDTPAYFSGWPSYMIDTSGMANRIMEWLTWTYRVSGELYFHATAAYEFGYRTPWTARYLFGGNGDGNLFLPGRPAVIGGSTHIPIETVRLKLIREGLEDYEYLARVAQLGDRAFADAQARTLVTNTYTWSHDPAVLYAARTALAQRILALQGSPTPAPPPPQPSNQLPIAALTATVSGLTVTANGSGSRDPDGTIASWAWTWGDGSQSAGATTAHAYAAAGTYTVTLGVTDNQGASAQAQQSVTVSEPPPPSGSVTRWEESDTRILRGPNAWSWGNGTNSAASGGGYLASATSGANLRVTFTGTGIRWIGVSDSCSGNAQVTVDGVSRVIDTYRAASSGWQSVTYAVTGLAATSHTLTVTVLGTRQAASCAAWVYFDAFDVTATTPNQVPVAALTTTVAGLTVTANGSGSRDPDGTIAAWLWTWGDGSQSSGSTSSHTYTTAGAYTVTLKVTDNLGATAQTQQGVTVSAPPPSSGTVTRLEESDSRIAQGPNSWSWGKGTNSAASGGGYLASATPGATLQVTFTGTAIKWIGISDSCSGQANMTVDGVARTIDTYSAASSGWQHVTYAVTGLAATSHTVTLTVLGTKQVASCAAWVYFDAFEVT